MSWDKNYDDWKLSSPDTEKEEELIEQEFEYDEQALGVLLENIRKIDWDKPSKLSNMFIKKRSQ
jgi:hypothetical protein